MTATTGGRRRAWVRGRRAESLCALLLRLKGYRIVARGFRAPVGEIDIVARRGNVLAVVEVKVRRDEATAAEAITARQRRRISRAAALFLSARPGLASLDVRFDVMLVVPRRLPIHIMAAWGN